jgi:hypothetical protein
MVILFCGTGAFSCSTPPQGPPQAIILSSDLDEVVRRGRGIYVSLMSVGLGSPLDPLSNWPQPAGYDHPWYQPLSKDPKHLNRTRVFSTSTEFFQWVMDAGLMNVDAQYFGVPGRMSQGQQRDTLERKRNIWCVTVGVERSVTPHGVPVLFTRNLSVTNLAHLSGPVRHSLRDTKPFGKEAVVIVLSSGAVIVLAGRQLDEDWGNVPDINPLAYSAIHP